MQEARFFRRRILLPLRRELNSYRIIVHRVGILLRRNRIRLTGYRRRFLNGHHGDARLDLALRPVVPPKEESNLVLVVHGLYPEIVNAVDKVPRLVSDLSTHPDDPPRPILPFLVIGIRGNFSFDGSGRHDKIGFRLSRLRIHLKQRREWIRSEEHTSELQSQSNIVCRLLLEKKKTIV